MSERRAFPRWAVALECETSAKRGNFPGVIQQLSEDGLGFTSGRVFDLGEELSIRWSLEPGGFAFRVQCVVRSASPIHTGVEFLNLTLGDRLRIMNFLSARDPRVQPS